MPRHARKQSSTQIYHVVIKGADRQLLFEEEKDYKKYLDILAYYKEELDFKIFAYCLMSNHVHLLIYAGTHSISSIFQRVNTRYAIWFNMKYNRTGFVQDGRFYSEPVENHSYFISALRYIHFNPTKAGLEKYPGEKYKWSSYYDYIEPASSFIDTDFLLSLINGSQNFLLLHCSEPSENFLEINTLRRRIPDDVARDIIKEISNCSTTTEFQGLSIYDRNAFIRQIHKKGVSVRQINRLTGTPRGIVMRIVNNKM